MKSGLCEIAQAPLTDLPSVLADAYPAARFKDSETFWPAVRPVGVPHTSSMFRAIRKSAGRDRDLFRSSLLCTRWFFKLKSRQRPEPARYRRKMFSVGAQTITRFAETRKRFNYKFYKKKPPIALCSKRSFFQPLFAIEFLGYFINVTRLESIHLNLF